MAATKRGALLACAVFAAASTAGCGTGSSPIADRCDPAAGPALLPKPVASGAQLPADPTASPAAALRAGLELLLREQADLLAYDTAAGLRPGAGSGHARGADTVLRANSAEISLALAGCDHDIRRQLSRVWRTRTRLFWRYGDAARRRRPTVGLQRNLAGTDRDIAKLLARRFEIDASRVGQQLRSDTAAVADALSSIARDDPAWPTALERAAETSDQASATWSSALARSEPLPDSPDAEPATLRAQLTGELVGPTALFALAAQASSTDQPQPATELRQASTALDNSAPRVWSSNPDGSGAPKPDAVSLASRQANQQLVDTATAIMLRHPASEIQPKVAELAVADAQLAAAFSQAHAGTAPEAVATTLQACTHTLLSVVRDATERRSGATWDIAAAEDGFAGLAAMLAKAMTRSRPPA